MEEIEIPFNYKPLTPIEQFNYKPLIPAEQAKINRQRRTQKIREKKEKKIQEKLIQNVPHNSTTSFRRAFKIPANQVVDLTGDSNSKSIERSRLNYLDMALGNEDEEDEDRKKNSHNKSRKKKKENEDEDNPVLGEHGQIKPFNLHPITSADSSSSGFSLYSKFGEKLHPRSTKGIISGHAREESIKLEAAERRENARNGTRDATAEAAAVDFIALRNRDCRNVILFPNQVLPPEQHIDDEGLPSPAWVVSLTQSIQSFKSCLVNNIIPFELIDRIRYYIDPTEKQYRAILAGHRTKWEREGRKVTTIEEVKDRIEKLSYTDKRRAEVLNFSRVVNNFFTSVEAPAEIMSVGRGCDFENVPVVVCPASQGDMPNSKKRQRSSSAAEFDNLQPVNIDTLQEIIDMAGNADNILRRLYGIHARFAVWNPYGPGPAGLKRFFLIYDGVIEQHIIAKITPKQHVELINTLDVLTASVGGGAITADAVAFAKWGRSNATTATAAATEVEFLGSTKSGIWEPSEGKNRELLRYRIRDVYKAWYTSLWVKSHLKHEQGISNEDRLNHCKIVELKLGYRRGTQYIHHHLPTFYELYISNPIHNLCSDVKEYIGEKGADISAAATRCCNFLGVDNEGTRITPRVRVPIEIDRHMEDLLARARHNRRMHDLVKGIGEMARAINQAARHGVASARHGVASARHGVASARHGATSTISFGKAASSHVKHLATKTIAAVSALTVDSSLVGSMMQMTEIQPINALTVPHQKISDIADIATSNMLVVGGGGGGIELVLPEIQLSDKENLTNIPPVILSISPAVISEGGEINILDTVAQVSQVLSDLVRTVASSSSSSSGGKRSKKNNKRLKKKGTKKRKRSKR